MSRPKVEAEHGTLTRYRQYLPGEKPCRVCKDAYNASVPEEKRERAREYSRRYSAITRQAQQDLRDAHPVDYRRFWDEAAAAYDQEQADLAWARVFAATEEDADV